MLASMEVICFSLSPSNHPRKRVRMLVLHSILFSIILILPNPCAGINPPSRRRAISHHHHTRKQARVLVFKALSAKLTMLFPTRTRRMAGTEQETGEGIDQFSMRTQEDWTTLVDFDVNRVHAGFVSWWCEWKINNVPALINVIDRFCMTFGMLAKGVQKWCYMEISLAAFGNQRR